MADIVFDLAITLRYVLDLGDEEMEIVDSGDSEENRDRVPCLHCKKPSRTIQLLVAIVPGSMLVFL